MTDNDDLTLAVIAERLKSLRDISERDFREIKDQIAEVRGLPSTVSTLVAQHASLERRVSELEDNDGRGVEFRRGQLPMILLTALVATIALVQLLHVVIR